MSYTDEQRKNHVEEIQRYIYNISFYNEKIPRIIPDGIYGPQTAAAVGSFQREYRLPVTGETDSSTWEKLVEIYFSFNNDTVLLEVFPKDLELMPGDRGIIIYIVQVILKALRKRFENIPEVTVSGVYDGKTQEAVDTFKTIAGIEKSVPGIDRSTWNSLASGFNMMEKKEAFL